MKTTTTLEWLSAAACLLLAASGCAPGDADAATTRETIGDTTIVHVQGAGEPWGQHAQLVEEVRIGELDGADEYTFGSIASIAVRDDGSIFVLDDQSQNVRVFDATGRHTQTFGRSGSGPGELKQPGGMVFLPDGRLVVRDPGNARMNIYDTAGVVTDTWGISGNFYTSAPLYNDTNGNIYTQVIAEQRSDGSWDMGLMKMDSTGATLDTLRQPIADTDAPRLIASSTSSGGTSRSISGVPFWPNTFTAMNAHGEYVGGNSARYAILTWKAEGKVQRIERTIEPVPVQQGEAAAQVERITRNMQRLQQDWNWSGPQPPATKPYFRQILTGLDGRIWVQLSQPAEQDPADPDAKPDAQGRMPVPTWTEPGLWDVFESDGSYLGSVAFPRRFTPHVMRGDYLWGTIRDEFDVEYVVRMRVDPKTERR